MIVVRLVDSTDWLWLKVVVVSERKKERKRMKLSERKKERKIESVDIKLIKD